jgi:hypothetical protein
MRSAISKTSIDALGERLRGGNLSDDDLRQLDSYRRTFADAYESVISAVRGLGLEPTGRPAKSTPAIVAKLRRGSIRLSQMQDIAGCRLVVDDRHHQDEAVHSLSKLFDQAVINDRRARPSHGYRAVHVIVTIDSRTVEIQVRTTLQHIWAETCEKVSDITGTGIKYGMGTPVHRDIFDALSEYIAVFEEAYLEAPPVTEEQILAQQELHSAITTMIGSLSEASWNDED